MLTNVKKNIRQVELAVEARAALMVPLVQAEVLTQQVTRVRPQKVEVTAALPHRPAMRLVEPAVKVLPQMEVPKV
jgi:hypothetical protein